jgi:hypothetical protein
VLWRHTEKHIDLAIYRLERQLRRAIVSDVLAAKSHLSGIEVSVRPAPAGA